MYKEREKNNIITPHKVVSRALDYGGHQTARLSQSPNTQIIQLELDFCTVRTGLL